MDFTELFVDVDDFWKQFLPTYQRYLLNDSTHRRRRQTRLSISEIMTILIVFQTSHDRNFKHFYRYLQAHHQHDFSDRVYYERLVKLMARA